MNTKKYEPDEQDVAASLAEHYEEITMDATYRQTLYQSTVDAVNQSGTAPTIRSNTTFALRWVTVASAAAIAAAVVIAPAFRSDYRHGAGPLSRRPAVIGQTPALPAHGNQIAAVSTRPTESRSVSMPKFGQGHQTGYALPINHHNNQPAMIALSGSPDTNRTNPLATPRQVAVLVNATGQITTGDGRRLNIGDRVSRQQTVKTGAAADAEFVTRVGSDIRLGPTTRVTFSSSDRITIQSGRLYCNNQDKEFAGIQTPTGAIKLLGTVLDTDVINRRTVAVTVIEGKVRLTNTHGDAVVEAGRLSILAAGEAPTPGAPVDTTAATVWYQGKGQVESDFGDIAYAVRPNSVMAEIWVVKPDGANRHRIATVLGWLTDVGPWLPGQRWIHTSVTSIVWNRPDERAHTADAGAGFPIVGNRDILIDAGTGRTQSLGIPTTYDPFYVAFAPNSPLVAFCGRYEPGGTDHPEQAESGVWVYDRGTGKMTKLLPGNIVTAPAWSPDGQRIAVSTGQGYTTDHNLVLVDASTGKVTNLGVNGAGVCFSPNGSQIAYSTNFRGGGGWMAGVPTTGIIEVSAPAPGSKPRQISRDGEGAFAPQWSPDGRRILYLTSDKRVCVAEADGSRVQDIYHCAQGSDWTVLIKSASWDATGKSIFINAIHGDKSTLIEASPDGAYTPRSVDIPATTNVEPGTEQQAASAAADVRTAVYQYAEARIHQFDGDIAAARSSDRQAANIFAGLIWAHPQSGLDIDDTLSYRDAALKTSTESTDTVLAETCKERATDLGYAVIYAACAHHTFPPDLPTAISWAQSAGWTIDWISNTDTRRVALMGMCPGTETHPAEAFEYNPPKAGDEPAPGDVLIKCLQHSDSAFVWKSYMTRLLHTRIMRNGKQGDWCALGHGLDVPYRFVNVGGSPLTITYNAIGDTYSIDGTARLVPTAKRFTNQTVSLGKLDERDVAATIDAAGMPDWTGLPPTEVAAATEQLAFDHAVALAESGKPVIGWKTIIDGEPARVVYTGQAGGSCGAFDSDLRFDLIGPGNIELYQLEPSGRFSVTGTVRITQTGETCTNGMIGKDGHVITHVRTHPPAQ